MTPWQSRTPGCPSLQTQQIQGLRRQRVVSEGSPCQVSASHHHFGIQWEWYHPLVSVLQDEEDQINCVYVLNLAIANVTSMPTLMDLQSPAVSGELLSCLNLVPGIVFSAGYDPGPFLLTAVVPEGPVPHTPQAQLA